ncbi:MAG: hypothetical protein OEZ15_00370 [Gammaproteobacteria bacterium]|nr:hypothetical protein [Gammaproteobacteria bacterium]
MKLLSGLFLFSLLLAGCNFKEAVKETGEGIEKGANNLIEGVKQAPKAIGDAARKIGEQGKEEE